MERLEQTILALGGVLVPTDDEPMVEGHTEDGLLAFSDKYWNHRISITAYSLDDLSLVTTPPDRG